MEHPGVTAACSGTRCDVLRRKEAQLADGAGMATWQSRSQVWKFASWSPTAVICPTATVLALRAIVALARDVALALGRHSDCHVLREQALTSSDRVFAAAERMDVDAWAGQGSGAQPRWHVPLRQRRLSVAAANHGLVCPRCWLEPELWAAPGAASPACLSTLQRLAAQTPLLPLCLLSPVFSPPACYGCCMLCYVMLLLLLLLRWWLRRWLHAWRLASTSSGTRASSMRCWGTSAVVGGTCPTGDKWMKIYLHETGEGQAGAGLPHSHTGTLLCRNPARPCT